jgi:hypothetical protein
MDVKWTEVIEALVALGTLFVTVIGFLIVIRQIRQVERTIRGDTNANLCAQSIEILKEIGACPECYPYFYENKELPPDEPSRVRILCICEMTANYLDHVALQRDNLPPAVWKRWSLFIRDAVQGSPVLREHFAKYRDWYSDEVLRLVDPSQAAPGRTAPPAG